MRQTHVQTGVLIVSRVTANLCHVVSVKLRSLPLSYYSYVLHEGRDMDYKHRGRLPTSSLGDIRPTEGTPSYPTDLSLCVSLDCMFALSWQDTIC
ncbi:uncharacterized protein B0H18DRAFT_1047961 [Fomitopsis serialis]|uniref:uncharacterized protein n=1 Tax=Fomitopsis serialis TaxID=139415 RepID=UPI00200757A9|nr:uncharacterized protein B0H18DRAFT_1047961 [Neoantrodia serialis]KAH9913624.1 hypothetical protein B0H18DRAFT_1047961 [Neoantrodia serialis]